MAARTSPGNTSLRMEEVRVRDFRGVKGELAVSFVATTGKPVSAIVFGENGSGKSSIVDGVEWACQGSIGRAVKFDARTRPRLLNAAAGAVDCFATVTLSDATRISRKASLDEDGQVRISPSGKSPAFGYVPMSLKRADILAFLEAAPEGRGALLMDHFLGDDTPSKSPVEREHDTADVVAAAKTRVRQAAAVVANTLGVEPPHELGSIRTMLNNDVYKGIAPRHRAAVQLPRPLVSPTDNLNRALADYEDAKRRRRASQVSTAATERVRRTHAILGDVGDWMTESFLRVTGASYVTQISVEVGRLGPMSLELNVGLACGFRGTPQRIFSEGYQDLIALLYFLAVARAAGEHGQAEAPQV